jgi:hypothetical protein
MRQLLLGLVLFAGIGLTRTFAEGSAEPEVFAALIRQAKTAVIAFESSGDPGEARDAVVTDRAWIGQCAALVAAGPLEPQPHCFCVSTPSLELYGDDGLLLKLTLHHASKLRSSGRIEGDFVIGKERHNALLALLMAEQTNARGRHVPPVKQAERKR